MTKIRDLSIEEISNAIGYWVAYPKDESDPHSIEYGILDGVVGGEATVYKPQSKDRYIVPESDYAEILFDQPRQWDVNGDPIWLS